MKQLLMALLLLVSATMSAEDNKHQVSGRTNLPEANVNGSISIVNTNPTVGSVVKVSSDPVLGYGLQKGIYYAERYANGEYSQPQLAKCKSPYPENRSKMLEFEFVMPDADVEVWAFFSPLRVLKVNQTAGGTLTPLYGYKESNRENVLRNVALQPIKLQIKPNDLYELVDVNVVNFDKSYCEVSGDTLTVYMPNTRSQDTLYVTPVFGKKNYEVTVKRNPQFVDVVLSDTTPKARQEVEAVVTMAKNYIPSNVSITGCKQWWRVGEPRRDSLGRWQVTYRFKVDLQDVTVSVGEERVYAFSVNDVGQSGRVETYTPEMIPGYQGVARKGQQIPVVFKMPRNYSVSYTTNGKTLTPIVYHNALTNSFADLDLGAWTETDDYVNYGLAMSVDADSTGNKYWRTSVKNSMSQTVSLSELSFPANAINKNKLSVAAIASINPNAGRKAAVTVETVGGGAPGTKWEVANLEFKDAGWQTVFKTGEVDAKADALKFVVDAEAENQDRKRAYGGPMFDDLCLLLPTEGGAIQDEDVLVFTMGEQDVVVSYTPKANQGTVSIAARGHATMTLHNVKTGEQGTTIKAMERDVIVVKGQADEGYAVYNVQCRQAGEDSDDTFQTLLPETVDAARREVTFNYVMLNDNDVTITPDVDVLKVNVVQSYGGQLAVSNEQAKAGETVTVTVTTSPGATLKQISTVPADIVTLTADSVDAPTGGGRYTFQMPASQISLKPEYSVSITTAEQFESLSGQYGDFHLDADLDLGTEWENELYLSGQFDGHGHRITYAGSTSLFNTINKGASVRHLYVTAKVVGRDSELGGIAVNNFGTIEDCEVIGTVTNKRRSGTAAGVAGSNAPYVGSGGIITHCHVVCDLIDGRTVCGIAYQEEGATMTDNIFNGRFSNSDGPAYMICNDEPNSTVGGNCYIADKGNERALLGSGVAATDSAAIIKGINGLTDRWPVYTASIRRHYLAYNIKPVLADGVQLLNISATTSTAELTVSGTVRVSGNNHLAGVTVTAPDGSDLQECTFTDNTENDYYFSFVMPEHDVDITFVTQAGKLIYTAKQLIDVNYKKGIYLLARDLELNNWNQKVNLMGTFDGQGHTIRYEASGASVGLFYNVMQGAVVQGLRVEASVESSDDCAGIAHVNNGTIRDCHFSGKISKVSSLALSENRVAAIAYKVGKESLIDHCSATGTLTSPSNQAAIDQSPLCAQSDATITKSVWVGDVQSTEYQELMNHALAERPNFPVYAQGILDKIGACIINGSDTIRLTNGETLSELTIVDGQPFVCTADAKVSRIVYKRKASNLLEQWVLPFAFDRISGKGTFEYHQTIEADRMPAIGEANTLTLNSRQSAIAYKANEPWLVKNDGGDDMMTYVLTNANGPITIQPTYNSHIARYASIMDVANFYTTYNGIPAATAKADLMYVWDGGRQEFVMSDGAADIQPYRFYLQFANKNSAQFVAYEDTWWSKNENGTATQNTSTARRRLAAAMADGWQPVFLDPRQPQSVTASMLDQYEVACLADVRADAVSDDEDAPLSAVSLVYQLVNSRMELPTAVPLLVRAKRSDAQPLADSETGAEIDSLLTLSLIQMLLDYENDEASDSLIFDMPHYWCAAFGNRLDIWPLPASESYADLAEWGCMMFNDNYFDQSFLYADGSDSRTTAPMSYCITLFNTDTYELLPLLGNRVSVAFITSPDGSEGGETGLTPSPSPKGEGSDMFNLSGQRVDDSYKGIVIQNGRKIYKK